MVAVIDEKVNVDVLEVLAIDSMLSAAIEVELVEVEVVEMRVEAVETVEVDPIPRYPKTAMHVALPHSSPASPRHGTLPGIWLEADKHSSGRSIRLT